LVARPLVVVPVLVAAAFGLLLAAIATTDLGLFRSRLSVADGSLHLRHSFGLNGHVVRGTEEVANQLDVIRDDLNATSWAA
jgi:hypothetical protein